MQPDARRRLLAIMFTDIQGYTSLMQLDETKAIAIRDRHRLVFKQTTKRFSGEVLQYYGDGTLSIFTSVVDAVSCGIEMQRAFQKKPEVPVRIGIHLGDIIATKEEIIGDAVNMASRIESMAVVGSVLISDRVERDLGSHSDIQTQSLGIFKLKNVERPVEVFAIANAGMIIPTLDMIHGKAKPYFAEVPNNLPNLSTSFIGRSAEISKIKELMQSQRVVTLYGPGGSGKTRLALEVARQELQQYPGGVFFIDLSPVESPDMVVTTFAQVLKINREQDLTLQDSIVKSISQKTILLVLDNCEHLIDRCSSFVNYLVTNTEIPRVLVTSREVLNIRSELRYYLSTLTVPERQITLEEIDQYESLLLFRDRACLNDPNFVLDKAKIGVVTSICKRLDGIPLALELAAARVNILDVDAILSRLDDQFRLLRSGLRSDTPRHQTIRATLDWSHNLLTEEEKILFYRLSIFSGDFDLEDVEAICTCDQIFAEDIIEHLSHLSDKSLVVGLQKSGTRRYRLLELMKEYGKEHLSDQHSANLHEQYCQFYLGKLESSYQEQHDKTMEWITWLNMESDNIEGALEMISSEPTKLASAVGHLYWYWYAGSNYLTGMKYMLLAEETYLNHDVLRGRIITGHGNIEGYYGQLKVGLPIANKGLGILREFEATTDLLNVLSHTAILELFIGHYEESESLCLEGLKLAKKLGLPKLMLRYKSMLAGVLTNQFFADEAEPMVIENLQEAKSLASAFDIDFNSHFYADLPMIREQYEEAAYRYLDAAQSALSHNNIYLSIIDLQGVGLCLCALGQDEEGLRVVGASMHKYKSMGLSSPENGFWNTLFMKTAGKTIETIGAKKAEKIMSQGGLMKFEDALAYAENLLQDRLELRQ